MFFTVFFLGIILVVFLNGLGYGYRGFRLLVLGLDLNRYFVISEEFFVRKIFLFYIRDFMFVFFYVRLRMRFWLVGSLFFLVRNRDFKNKVGGGVFWEVGIWWGFL